MGGSGDQFAAVASPDGGALVYFSDESGKREASLVSLSMVDGRPTPGPDRQRVPVDDLLTMRWSMEGDEIYVLSSQSRVFTIPVARQGGRLSLGTATHLFDLTEAHADKTFGVGAGDRRFIFSIEPNSKFQPLSVLVGWPERIE